MEHPQQQLMNHDYQENNGSNKGGGNNNYNNASCVRQSSTRWTPTTEQIRILKELYYNNGVRSPTADQIQKISVRLRQYGKIEGKNVFYWFQNHKARERQKKRLFPSPPSLSTPPDNSHFHHNYNNMPIIHHIPQDYSNISKKYYNGLPSGISCASSSSQAFGVAHQMGSLGYSSVTMEKNFRDCSISAGESRATLNPNFGWVEMDHPNSKLYPLHDQNNFVGYYDEPQELEEVDDDEQQGPELETLPLFPMHAENINGFYNPHQSLPETDTGGRYYSGWYCSGGDYYGGSRTSLELSLNSYAGRAPPDSA